ncbi:MAG: hypothetical protein C0179_02440 [Fervidicoccus sp.]|nr:MAG: hypothetical protein C0179_02440 [Fervidicoccus sp.]
MVASWQEALALGVVILVIFFAAPTFLLIYAVRNQARIYRVRAYFIPLMIFLASVFVVAGYLYASYYQVYYTSYVEKEEYLYNLSTSPPQVTAVQRYIVYNLTTNPLSTIVVASVVYPVLVIALTILITLLYILYRRVHRGFREY